MVNNNLPAIQETQETQVRSLRGEDPLEKGMATHFSLLAWRIPWIEESRGLQSIELQESDIAEMTEYALFYNTILFFYFFVLFWFLFYFLTLQYCIGFAIYQNESATGIHVFPILNHPPSPYRPSGSSQCTSPKHPVSCIEPGLATRFIYDIIHVSMPFSQIIPPSPSPTESKRLFYTSVSLLLSCIQGYCYHLSKFHIYALVYCIGVFLSGLLHSV